MLASQCPLAFDPTTHTYTLQGVRVPSVTQVLKATGYITLDGIPADVLERARDRGARVHQALHYLFENDLDHDSIDDSIRGYLESAESYIATHVTEIVRVEMRVWSARHYCAGTLDLFAQHRDGCLFIGDFKTGDPADVAADLQTAAYHAFTFEMAATDEDLARTLIVPQRLVKRRSIRLFADGRPGRETTYDQAHDLVRFLNALNVVHDQAQRQPVAAWDDER